MSTPARDALDDKVNQVFAGKCVRKDLVRGALSRRPEALP